MRTNGARVAVVGSVNMDLVVTAPRLPRPGETVTGGGFMQHPGGKGANQAVAAARLGARAALVARVGADAFGDRRLDDLRAEGVDLSGMSRDPVGPTGVALITVDRSGENTIVVAPGANAALEPGHVDAAAACIAGSGALLVQLEVPLGAVTQAVGLARETGVPVLLNAAPARPLPAELLEQVDVLLVNRGEAAALTDMDPDTDPERLLDALVRLEVPTVLLTLGAGGVLLHHRVARDKVPAFPVQAVDTVGAGDAFAGALAERRAGARGAWDLHDVREAARWAAGAGALAATRPGATPSLPRRSELEALVGES